MCFIDQEKYNGTVNRKDVWEFIKIYGMREHISGEVKSFYEGNEACVRADSKESDMLRVKVGLRQGYVMSSWLFNL